MQNIISLLKKQCALNKRENFNVRKVKSENCAVIIEPREHEMIEPAIRNVMSNLLEDHGNYSTQGWNLHIFCGNKNYEYIKNLFPNWDIEITNLGVDNLSQDQYSSLLKSKDFWNKINAENILIFQLDNFVLNGFDIYKYLDFSFVGSPYNWDPDRHLGTMTERLAPPGHPVNMNGGFSFRKKSSMLRCISEVSPEDILKWRRENNCETEYFKEPWMGGDTTSELAEDVYFHNALAMLGETLPSHDICANFCHQHSYSQETNECRAIHGYDKYCTEEASFSFSRRQQATKPILFIYAGYSHEPFNGADYSGKRGVRGSEIGMINLAENLTSAYDVYVGGGAIKEGSHNNVTYFGEEKINMFLDNAKVDSLIINRYVHYLLNYRNRARKTFVWVQDVGVIPFWKGTSFPDDGKPFLHNLINKINGFICLSDPHVKEFNKHYELPENKIFKIGNGLTNPDHFNKNIEKVPNRFIYSSLPERGLDILLDWFPDIKKELPDAELHVFTDLDITPNNLSPEQLKEKMKNIDGVIFRGKVSNEVMLDEFQRSDVLLYPNIFFETFCTSALEAQAAGCIVVTRKYGALEEVVADRGILIDGDPYTPEFKHQAINKMLEILRNPEKKRNLQEKARLWALEKTWENRSLDWIELLQK